MNSASNLLGSDREDLDAIDARKWWYSDWFVGGPHELTYCLNGSGID